MLGWAVVWVPARWFPDTSVLAPEAGLTLAALGLALCVGITISVLVDGIHTFHFGWRQPAVIIGAVAVALPALAFTGDVLDGRWDAPTSGWANELAFTQGQTDKGDFQMFQVGWSGRVDPDGNISNFVHSEGSQNNNGYANSTVDSLLEKSQTTEDQSTRADLFGQVITQLHKDLPIIYVYRLKNFTGVSRKVVGVQMYGDGLMRFAHAGFAAG